MVSKEQWKKMCVKCRCGHPAHYHTDLVGRTVCYGCACSEFQPMPMPDQLRAEQDALKGADDGNGCPWKPMFYEERAKRVAAEADAHMQSLERNDANQRGDELEIERDALKKRLAAIRAWATSERPSIPKHIHDDRWCSHCDSLIDGVGHAQATVLRILDGDVNL